MTGLAEHLDPAQQHEALRTATTITTDTLTRLTEHLNPDQLDEALRAATTITDDYSRATALTGLAEHLDPDQRPAVLDEALRAATTITYENFRASALTRLAEHLDPNQLRTMLRIDRGHNYEVAHAALTRLAALPATTFGAAGMAILRLVIRQTRRHDGIQATADLLRLPQSQWLVPGWLATCRDVCAWWP